MSKSYQLCLKKLRDIESCAEEDDRNHIEGHIFHCLFSCHSVEVLVWVAHSTEPFKGDDNCEEDGTVEDDVVERVDNLWEEDGIHLTVVIEWPLEH